VKGRGARRYRVGGRAQGERSFSVEVVMRRVVFACVVLGVVLGVPAAARAQGYFTPNIGYDFSGDAGNCPSLFNDCAEKKLSYGVVFGKLSGGIIGFEEDVSFAPDFFGQSKSFASNSVLSLMSNLIVAIPAGAARPYLSAGVGVLRTSVDLTAGGGGANFSDTSFGYDIGAGLMVLLPHHVGLRADIRRFQSASDISIVGISLSDRKLSFMRASIGLVLH
jgi:opacity protein-like surface antigen